jgi:hypothetical protein
MRPFVLRVLGLLLASVAGFAQSGVSGRILDPQGASVPGARVHLESSAGFHLSTKSDSEGRYRFGSVPGGDYLLTADAPGLAGIGVNLTLVGQLAIQDITLARLAAQHQSIVITPASTPASTKAVASRSRSGVSDSISTTAASTAASRSWWTMCSRTRVPRVTGRVIWAG